MSDHDGFYAGNLYATTSDNWLSSSQAQTWNSAGYWYGGAYADTVTPGNVPGENSDLTHGPSATSFTYLTPTLTPQGTPVTPVAVLTGTLDWAQDKNLADPDNMYLVTVDLTGFTDPLSGDLPTLSLFWGTGTCSNDGIQGGGGEPRCRCRQRCS